MCGRLGKEKGTKCPPREAQTLSSSAGSWKCRYLLTCHWTLILPEYERDKDEGGVTGGGEGRGSDRGRGRKGE